MSFDMKNKDAGREGEGAATVKFGGTPTYRPCSFTICVTLRTKRYHKNNFNVKLVSMPLMLVPSPPEICTRHEEDIVSALRCRPFVFPATRP